MGVSNKKRLRDYLKGRHSVSKLAVHLVFTTQYRKKLFTGVMIEQLREAFDSACEKLGCEIVEMEGSHDYVHLLVSYPPKLSISVMVNSLKAVSSRMLRLQHTHLLKHSKTVVLWSRSYFACTAGTASPETLNAYIESQFAPTELPDND